MGQREGASSIQKTRAYFLSSKWECTQALNQQSHTYSPPVSGCNEVIYEAVLTIGLIAPMKSELALVKWIALSGNCVQDIHWRSASPSAARLLPKEQASTVGKPMRAPLTATMCKFYALEHCAENTSSRIMGNIQVSTTYVASNYQQSHAFF